VTRRARRCPAPQVLHGAVAAALLRAARGLRLVGVRPDVRGVAGQPAGCAEGPRPPWHLQLHLACGQLSTCCSPQPAATVDAHACSILAPVRKRSPSCAHTPVCRCPAPRDAPPGNIASIYLVDRLGRRLTACACMAGACVCALAFAVAPANGPWPTLAACVFSESGTRPQASAMRAVGTACRGHQAPPGSCVVQHGAEAPASHQTCTSKTDPRASHPLPPAAAACDDGVPSPTPSNRNLLPARRRRVGGRLELAGHDQRRAVPHLGEPYRERRRTALGPPRLLAPPAMPS
jgi:hypothetical protein